MNKGILYVSWGCNHMKNLHHSAKYSKRTNLPLCLIADKELYDNVDKSLFDEIIICNKEIKSEKVTKYFSKLFMYKSPFENTLYLDNDTIIWKTNLDYAFNKSLIHGLCCTYGTIESMSELSVINGGVLFFSKNKTVENIFCRALDLCSTTDFHPQLALTIIMDEINFNPVILENNWNYSTGDQVRNNSIKIFHEKKKGDITDYSPDTHHFSFNKRTCNLVQNKIKLI